MRKKAKLGLAVLSALTLLTTPATASAAENSPAKNNPPAGVGNSHAGASRTGVYPNVFVKAGISRRAVDARVNAAWQQLFHGDPGTDATHRGDGQAIYYQLTPDMAYVEDIGNQDVRTEGMGYAMMMAVQLGHKHEFDSLWNFAKTKMQLQSGKEKYFFAWHTDTTGKILSTGVAPDGDQWIAAALAFAEGRWGNGDGIYDYGTEARQILHAMWHESDNGGVDMFDRKYYLPLFTPPATFLYFTDPSYALPAFYKVFAAVDKDDKDLWDKAYDAGEKLLQDAHNPQTGLTPDYANFDGTPYFGNGETPTDNSYTHNFQEDAWRAIANANVDAAWFGTKPWQKEYSNTLENFFEGQGVTTYVSRYHLDGTPLSSGQNTYEPAHAQGLVAMNSTSAITATDSARRAFVRDFWNTEIPSGYARYYDGMLYMLGLLYDSGKFRIWTSPSEH
ncbi:glycosyl hydrolase family 8 [Actinoallomurus rhizosphaericola]|uniref:glycosyl hydrolase family 8 n=1 Tax=Actinoallomurus rhizosphaericola TaxID=2952536 RepID=UPI002092A5B7|nr:glycosyl hydrolase family 8 [Actinoallomurus rhizosphaericola]MCO5997998.1 glycosyl hydrolase family 8 [Actinoallomurus rhizosphaericola]